MVIDERAYTLDVREVGNYIANSRDAGQAVQKKHGANLVAAFTTNTAMLNQYVHWWAWNSPDERDAGRSRRDADPEWKAYVASNRGRVLRQENRMLVPTEFALLKDKVPPLKGKALAYEERTYTLYPGQSAAFCQTVRDQALPLFERYGYELVGLYTVDVGTLNQVVFLQRWKSLDERGRIAAEMVKDKAFQEYRATNVARVITQEMRFLIPTDFSPLQ